jgi:hypothetical protein
MNLLARLRTKKSFPKYRLIKSEREIAIELLEDVWNFKAQVNIPKGTLFVVPLEPRAYSKSYPMSRYYQEIYQRSVSNQLHRLEWTRPIIAFHAGRVCHPLRCPDFDNCQTRLDVLSGKIVYHTVTGCTLWECFYARQLDQGADPAAHTYEDLAEIFVARLSSISFYPQNDNGRFY